MSAKITDSKATVLLCVPAINIRVAKQAAENSTVTSQENVETEELEIGGEDSWEDSADGWD